jgi:hypothetical protein
MDPDLDGPKTYGFGSATLLSMVLKKINYRLISPKFGYVKISKHAIDTTWEKPNFCPFNIS